MCTRAVPMEARRGHQTPRSLWVIASHPVTGAGNWTLQEQCVPLSTPPPTSVFVLFLKLVLGNLWDFNIGKVSYESPESATCFSSALNFFPVSSEMITRDLCPTDQNKWCLLECPGDRLTLRVFVNFVLIKLPIVCMHSSLDSPLNWLWQLTGFLIN